MGYDTRPNICGHGFRKMAGRALVESGSGQSLRLSGTSSVGFPLSKRFPELSMIMQSIFQLTLASD